MSCCERERARQHDKKVMRNLSLRRPTVSSIAWLGRWWGNIIKYVVRGASPHLSAARRKLAHDRVLLTDGAVRSRLEPGRRALPKQAIALDESEWLALLKLIAQINIFRFKLFYASLRLRKLLLENRKLLAQKRDMLALYDRGAVLLDESLNGSEQCAELHRPNEQ